MDHQNWDLNFFTNEKLHKNLLLYKFCVVQTCEKNCYEMESLMMLIKVVNVEEVFCSFFLVQR